jgi:hypothetical protein
MIHRYHPKYGFYQTKFCMIDLVFNSMIFTFVLHIKIHRNVKPTEPRGRGGQMMRALSQNKELNSSPFIIDVISNGFDVKLSCIFEKFYIPGIR